MPCTSESYQKRPGRFELSGELGEKLYEKAKDGCDEEVGSVDELGWYGLLLDSGLPCAAHAIVSEDLRGHWNYEPFGTKEEAETAWAEVKAKHDEYHQQVEA